MNRVVLLLSVVLVVGCSFVTSNEPLNRNKELVRRTHADVWSRGNMRAADEIYDPDFVAHWLGGDDTDGRDKFKALVADGRRRAPDLKETIYQMVAEGDLVVSRFTS